MTVKKYNSTVRPRIVIDFGVKDGNPRFWVCYKSATLRKFWTIQDAQAYLISDEFGSLTFGLEFPEFAGLSRLCDADTNGAFSNYEPGCVACGVKGGFACPYWMTCTTRQMLEDEEATC